MLREQLQVTPGLMSVLKMTVERENLHRMAGKKGQGRL